VDFRPVNDEQSAWLIDDEKSNLERVLVAMAANNAISDVGYILFDPSAPGAFGIAVKESIGGTADETANRTWHRDLVDLTARQLAEFVVEIHKNGFKDQLLPKETEALIKKGIASGELDKSKINSSLLKKLK
jgi:hypothetical protein